LRHQSLRSAVRESRRCHHCFVLVAGVACRYPPLPPLLRRSAGGA
jgi:hypothetical protein